MNLAVILNCRDGAMSLGIILNIIAETERNFSEQMESGVYPMTTSHQNSARLLAKPLVIISRAQFP